MAGMKQFKKHWGKLVLSSTVKSDLCLFFNIVHNNKFVNLFFLFQFPKELDDDDYCFLELYHTLAQEMPFPRISVAAWKKPGKKGKLFYQPQSAVCSIIPSEWLIKNWWICTARLYAPITRNVADVIW